MFRNSPKPLHGREGIQTQAVESPCSRPPHQDWAAMAGVLSLRHCPWIKFYWNIASVIHLCVNQWLPLLCSGSDHLLTKCVFTVYTFTPLALNSCSSYYKELVGWPFLSRCWGCLLAGLTHFPFCLPCSHCSSVIEALKSLPSNEKSRDRQARCIWYLDTLIKFRAQKVIKRKSKSMIDFFFLIEIQSIYNMFVSSMLQSDSVTCVFTHIYILFQIFFHYKLLQDTVYNSLCYTVGPCYFIYSSVYLLVPNS